MFQGYGLRLNFQDTFRAKYYVYVLKLSFIVVVLVYASRLIIR